MTANSSSKHVILWKKHTWIIRPISSVDDVPGFIEPSIEMNLFTNLSKIYLDFSTLILSPLS